MTNEELELYADQYCIDKFGAKTGNKAVRDALIDGYNLALRIHDVVGQNEQLMGSLIKPLNWIDNPEKRRGDIYKVMSRADVPMPHTVGNACIEITEQTYPYEYYEATLWCFNRGTNIAEGKSVDEAKSKAFRWLTDFVCGFLYCP